MSSDSKLYEYTDEFLREYGSFYHAWALAEATLDFAIGKFLRLSDEETHILTAGMPHGRKCLLLQSLIGRTDHPRKNELLGAIRIIQNESMRNQFAHSYIMSLEDEVTFIERSHTGLYRAKEHVFTPEQFTAHVDKFCAAFSTLYKGMEIQPFELALFMDAALNINSKE